MVSFTILRVRCPIVIKNYRMNVTQLLGLLKTSKGKQASGLFATNILNLPLAVIISLILTRMLGEVAFGNYSFLISIFNFAIVIFTFGFFQASSRAILVAKSAKMTEEYFGAALVFLVFLYVLMALSLFIYAIFDNNIKEKHLFSLFLVMIPLSFVFLFTRYFETILQADNKIKELAISRLFPKIGFVAASIALFFLWRKADKILSYVMFSYIFTQLVVYGYVMLKIKISFKNLKTRLSEIWSFNKVFGLHVYFGSLFSLGVAQSTSVLISYFSHDNSGVGFYALALSFASPLMMIPNTLSTIYYKDFITFSKIPKKILVYTAASTIIVFLIISGILPFFVIRFYGPTFKEVISLFLIVGVGSILYGLGDFYNRYLGAHGRGKELRNSAFIVGAILILLNYLLVPDFKEFGAAYAYVGGGLTYLLCMSFFYLKFTKLTN